MRLHPLNVQVIGDLLAIKWNDQRESFFELEHLRRACPCAACAGEPDVLGRISNPAKSVESSEPVGLRSYQFVGGYAIQPVWADGHNTGIYSYEYLRKLEQPAPVEEGTP